MFVQRFQLYNYNRGKLCFALNFTQSHPFIRSLCVFLLIHMPFYRQNVLIKFNYRMAIPETETQFAEN